jgi:hypothetical protein
MSLEPERPIEKLLQETARRRRDAVEGTFRLHPATRRLLQGEVKRTLGAPPSHRRSLFDAVAQNGPRLVWGMVAGAALVILGVMVMPMLRSPESETLLAKNENSLSPDTAMELTRLPADLETVTNQPAPAEAAILIAADERAKSAAAFGEEEKDTAQPLTVDVNQDVGAVGQDSLKKAEIALKAASARPVAAAPQTLTETAPVRRYGLARSDNSPPTPTAAAAPPAAAGGNLASAPPPITQYRTGPVAANRTATGSAVGRGFSAGSNPALFAAGKVQTLDRLPAAGQQFIAATPRSTPSAGTLASSLAMPVLTSFQVQQSGGEVRILDQDGSVYLGSIELGDARSRSLSDATAGLTSPPPPRLAQKTALSEATKGSSAQWAGILAYPFTVSGTNVTLQQKVVFSGNLLLATNALIPTWITNATPVGPGFGAAQAQSSIILPLLNARIAGRAAIGAQPQVEINAVSAKP